MTQSINEQIGTLPAIESELHFFEVGRKMFGANSVPRSHDATFEKREGEFDGVGVNVSMTYTPELWLIFLWLVLLAFRIAASFADASSVKIFFHILTDIFADI